MKRISICTQHSDFREHCGECRTFVSDSQPYWEAGFDSRSEYLESLADDIGARLSTVRALADLLGPEEDFDGLITTLEDAVDF